MKLPTMNRQHGTEKTMGNWHISIRGTGCHHNKDLPKDANRMAAGFVDALKRAGHTIQAAAFTHGGEENLEDLGDLYGGPTPMEIAKEVPGPTPTE